MEKVIGQLLSQLISFLFAFFLCSGVRASCPADTVLLHVTNGIKDGYTGLVLPNAKVTILDSIGNVLCDSVPVEVRKKNYVESYNDLYSYSYFTKVVKRSKYLFDISAHGYESRQYELKPFNRGNNYGVVALTDEVELFPVMRPKMLDEVSVTASKIKMVMKGDTIEYDATAFRLAEGSMLDNLIRALPGAQLADNGRITVNGKFVSELLVNGRDFFKGDPKVALANLPAYTVNKISVFHKTERRLDGKDPQAATETDPLVMDVRLKREYAKGLISNYELGGGSGLDGKWDTKWLARVFAMRFSPVSSLAVYANANNLNAEQQPGRNGEWSRTDIASGRVTTKSAGVDFSHDWKERDTKLSTTLTATRRNRFNENTSLGEDYLEGGNTFSSSAFSSHADATSVNWNGRVEKYWKYVRLTVAPTAYYNHNTSDYEMEQTRRDDDGKEVYSRRRYSDSRTDSRGGDISVSGAYGKMPAEWLSAVSMELKGGYSSSTGRGHDVDMVSYPSGNATDINLIQKSRQPNYGYYFRAGLTPLNFSPPIRGDVMMWGNVSYAYDYRYDSGKRILHERVNDPELASAGENELWELDRRNSYHTTERTHNHTIDAEYVLQTPVYVQVSLRNQFMRRNIIDCRVKTQSLSRNDYVFSGRFSMSNKTGGEGSKYGFKLYMDQEAPRMLSMLTILDSADPLWQNVGNPNLKKSSVYGADLHYTYDRNDKNRHVNISVGYEQADNAISMAHYYDRTTGVTILRPQNINGNFSGRAGADYSRYIDRMNRIYVSNAISGSMIRSVDFSTDTENMHILKVNKWNIYEQFQLKCSIGRANIGAKVQLTWNRLVSLSDIFSPFSYLDVNYGVSAATPLLWGIDLQTDLMAYCRRGYEKADLNTTDWVWNLTLSKAFGKGNAWVVKARGYDILHQLPNVRQFVNAQGRTETRYNTIPAYAVVSLTYRLDIKPQKK